MPFNDVPVPNPFIIHRFSIPLDLYWDETKFFSGDTHPEYEIVHLLDGEVECAEERRVYHLRAGDMLLHAPDEFHNIRSAPDSEPNVRILTFQIVGTPPNGLENGVFRISEELREEFDQVFAEVFALYHDPGRDEFFPQECGRRAENFLIHLGRTASAEPRRVLTRGAEEYNNLVTSMKASVFENYTLEEISQKHNISVSYIKVLFRRFAGVSPKAYYARLRCDEAIRLLQSGCSAAETADRLNFSSPNHFSVFFKKMTGQPPVRYIIKKEQKL